MRSVLCASAMFKLDLHSPFALTDSQGRGRQHPGRRGPRWERRGRVERGDWGTRACRGHAGGPGHVWEVRDKEERNRARRPVPVLSFQAFRRTLDKCHTSAMNPEQQRWKGLGKDPRDSAAGGC